MGHVRQLAYLPALDLLGGRYGNFVTQLRSGAKRTEFAWDVGPAWLIEHRACSGILDATQNGGDLECGAAGAAASDDFGSQKATVDVPSSVDARPVAASTAAAG